MEAPTLIEEIGEKDAGQLIKHTDWNRLVEEVVAVESRLRVEITALDDRLTGEVAGLREEVDTLRGDVDTLRGDADALREDTDALRGEVETLTETVTALEQAIEPFRSEYYRLTLETTKVRYALGELAEIVARVTDLEGNALDLVEANRPWIDFIVTWGQVKVVDSFESRGGADDRTVSVRTNLSGEARILLRAEHVEGLSEETETAVSESMKTTLAFNSRTLAATLLDAATPLDARQTGAFTLLRDEYDREEAVSLRTYVDAYYLRNTTRLSRRVVPQRHEIWRDHRATVLASVKDDSDPQTPDQSRGLSTIQVTFRDWIGPWILTDYLPEVTTLVADYRSRLTPRITTTLTGSITNIKAEINESLLNQGVVGKLRHYRAIFDAMDEVNPASSPAFLESLKKSVKDAVSIQQKLESVQGATAGLPVQEVAFEVFTNAATRSEADVDDLRLGLSTLQDQVNLVDSRVQTVDNKVGEVELSVSHLDGQVNTRFAAGGQVQLLENRLQTIEGQVGNLSLIEPTRVTETVELARQLETRLNLLER